MRVLAPSALMVLLLFSGCVKQTPLSPSSQEGLSASTSTSAAPQTGRSSPGQPGYEPAYVNGQTVTINAVEVPNKPNVPTADLFEVVYPIGWQQLGLAPPQCNPCDHDHNGIDMLDFHDHILDSAPGIQGYRPLWHVWVVVPAYQQGNDAYNTALSAAYAQHLPTKSEVAVDSLLSATFQGNPLAVKIDTQFYFLCAVVGGNHLSTP